MKNKRLAWMKCIWMYHDDAAGRLYLDCWWAPLRICGEPRDQLVSQNPNVRWGHVFASVLRLCGSFCWHVKFHCWVFLCSTWLWVLILPYAPLSLRPLTCEVKTGHRWGPREQGCIQFQHFVKEYSVGYLYMFVLGKRSVAVETVKLSSRAVWLLRQF